MSKLNINIISTWNIKCGIADYSKSFFNSLKKHDYLDISIHPIKRPETKNPLYFVRLLKNINEHEITHIQYQNSLFGPVPYFLFNYFPLIIFILKFWKKNTVVTTVHEFDPYLRLDRISLKFLNLSDKIIVHDEKTMYSLHKKGIPENKLILMVQGTPDPVIFEKNECKQKLNVKNKKVLTIFGFVHENKGHDLLIDTLKELNEDFILFIVGEARLKGHQTYYNKLKNNVSSLNLEKKVKFLNFVDEKELPIIFSATDIAIFPYRRISTSAALNVALSYKIPVLASDLSYFREINCKYGCLELFKKEDEKDLLAKIQGLLKNKKKVDYLKKKSEQFYNDNNWEKIAEKNVNIYLEIIGDCLE